MSVLTRSASKRAVGSPKRTRKKKRTTPKKKRVVAVTLPIVVPEEEDEPQQAIVVSPRPNDFTASSWWMVDLNCEPPPKQGATALVARCMRKCYWDEEHARRVLLAYKQFLELKKSHQDWDATVLSPCPDVDRMWHEHILDIVNYCHDTMLLCGRVVGHNPDGGLEEEAKRNRTQATRQALADRFGDDYDEELWLTRAEWKEKQRAEEERLYFEGLLETHQVRSVPGGSRRRDGKHVTLVMKLENGQVQLIKFGCRRKLSSVFASYYRNIYQGEESLKDLHFRTRRGGVVHETARELNLEDGAVVNVVCALTVITISVRDQSGELTRFKTKKGSRLYTLMILHAHRKGVNVASLRFLLDGERIDPDWTPISLDLVDYDQIDCMLEQTGC